jgi:hypothetical protein
MGVEAKYLKNFRKISRQHHRFRLHSIFIDRVSEDTEKMEAQFSENLMLLLYQSKTSI